MYYLNNLKATDKFVKQSKICARKTLYKKTYIKLNQHYKTI